MQVWVSSATSGASSGFRSGWLLLAGYLLIPKTVAGTSLSLVYGRSIKRRFP